MVSKITDSEFLVMRVLWEAGQELTITQIREALEKTTDWNSSTIKTLIRRLVNKGAVEASKKEVYYYKPLITEAEYNKCVTKDLIDRLYNGSAKNLVASLIDNKNLTEKDIEELRSMFKVGGKNK